MEKKKWLSVSPRLCGLNIDELSFIALTVVSPLAAASINFIFSKVARKISENPLHHPPDRRPRVRHFFMNE